MIPPNQTDTDPHSSKSFRKIPKRLTMKQIQAAVQVAEDRLTDVEIAARAGVSDRALRNWKAIPAFAEQVEKNRIAFQNRVLGSGVALKAKRMEVYEDLAKRMRFVIQERAHDAVENAEMAAVPGAKSGLIVKTEGRRTAGGVLLDAKYHVDTSLTSELRTTLRQAAEEMGDLKKDVLAGASDRQDDMMKELAEAIRNSPTDSTAVN